MRERNTKLRQENEQLYEGHVRRLTVDNTRLANELATRSGVTDLSAHGHDTQVSRDHPRRPGHDEPGVIPAVGFVFVADAASIVSRGFR